MEDPPNGSKWRVDNGKCQAKMDDLRVLGNLQYITYIVHMYRYIYIYYIVYLHYIHYFGFVDGLIFFGDILSICDMDLSENDGQHFFH